MTGWNLQSGRYTKDIIEEGEVLGIVKKALRAGSDRTTPYKYIFFAALLDNIENVGEEFELTFKQIYTSFAKIYFNKYKIYHKAIRRVESTKRSALEQEMDYSIEDGWFHDLEREKQQKLIKSAEEIGSKYAIGAFFEDTEEVFYSFSKQKKLLLLNPSVYLVLKQYKEEFVRANNYSWNSYMYKNFDVEQIDSWSRPKGASTLIGRKQVDKSIILNGETGIPKDFVPHFKLACEVEELWMPGERNAKDLILEYEGMEYGAKIAKRTTGTMALYIKSRELREIIDKVFKRSKEYVLERQIEGRKLAITVPEELAEYIEFYECEGRIDKYYIVLSTDKIGVDKEMEDDRVLDNQIKQLQDIEVKKHIDAIHTYIQSKGFTYSYETIANLYLSLKTKPFAILAGISGTGKSKLVELFAEALGATVGNGRYKLIAVRPDWSDSTDLLGYRDLNNTFNPGILTTLIERAAEDRSHSYFVCLDEMNLARVEYYFSDFLAIIESRKWQGEEIVTHPILQESILGNDREVHAHYKVLGIPDNLYIIGTVNMDETTFPFSKKVLDRASTIEFSNVELLYFFDYVEEKQSGIETVSNHFLRSDYISIHECREYRVIAERTMKRLLEVNQILQLAQMQFAYRVRDEIVFYMIYNERFSLMDEQVAFDLQLLQKVLPRLSGTSETMRKTLEKLKNWCEGNYDQTALKLRFMIERYDQDGFTSYWM